jgi:hypothetical protein
MASPYSPVAAIGHTLAFKMSQERPRKIPVIDQVAESSSAACTALPQPQPKRDRLLTLSDPAASLSLTSEYALDVTVQCFHDANARQHRRPVLFRNEQ